MEAPRPSDGEPPRCDCGCGTIIDRRKGRRYRDRSHGQRAYRRRLKARLQAAGLPASLSMKAADAAIPPPRRNGDATARRTAPQRRRTPDRRVSLDAAVAAIAEWLADEPHPLVGLDPRAVAREILDPALPPRLRRHDGK